MSSLSSHYRLFSVEGIQTKTGKWVSLYILTLFMITVYAINYKTKYLLQTPTHFSPLMENSKGIDQNEKENQVHFQNISECLCSRKFMYPPNLFVTNGENAPRLNSSCSDQGTYYESEQNVISFSLYIPSPRGKKQVAPKLAKEYFEGLRQNLQRMRHHYPGYSIRLYTNLPLQDSYCSLLCNNPDLFWCNVMSIPSHGDLSGMVFRTWRFLPLGDPTVNIFLSRDLDSLISPREAGVVQDWLSKTDKPISLMRDRKRGHNVPILAGMWQVSNKKLGVENASLLREKIISLSKRKSEHAYKSSDQSILNKAVFYPEAGKIVAYDSYNCVKWSKFTATRPFPTQIDDPSRDFVGNRVDFAGGKGKFNYSKEECPLECRPEYGKEWIYC